MCRWGELGSVVDRKGRPHNLPLAGFQLSTTLEPVTPRFPTTIGPLYRAYSVSISRVELGTLGAAILYHFLPNQVVVRSGGWSEPAIVLCRPYSSVPPSSKLELNSSGSALSSSGMRFVLLQGLVPLYRFKVRGMGLDIAPSVRLLVTYSYVADNQPWFWP